MIGSLYIPSLEVSSSGYEDFYYTNSFQFSKLVFILVLLFTGFLFVTSVTLRLRRKNSFEGRNGTKRDIAACMGLGILLYPLGPNATILGFDDENSLSMLIIYDYVIYTISFTLGLLWTHLDTGVLG